MINARSWMSNFYRLMSDSCSDHVTRPSPSAGAERMPKWWRSDIGTFPIAFRRASLPPASRRAPLALAFCRATLPLAFRLFRSHPNTAYEKYSTVYSISCILHNFDKRVSPYILRFALWHLYHLFNPILFARFL